MDNKTDLVEVLSKLIPLGKVTMGNQYPEIVVNPDNLHETSLILKNFQGMPFDFLIDATAVDFVTHFLLVFHLESTNTHQVIVLKTQLEDHDNPNVESVSDIWSTAEFQEREIFDLFGISFKNHPDLRRLFMEDDYGYPLRKDFKDEINIIEYPN